MGIFISSDFSPRGSLQCENSVAMECIVCRQYFAPSTCNACWRAYWSRVARNFQKDGSRSRPNLARNLFAACLRVIVCTRTGARRVEVLPPSAH